MIFKSRRVRIGAWNWAGASVLAALVMALFSFSVDAEEQINPRSGQLSLTVTDLVVADGPVKLELQRSFSSSGNAQRLLGTRWVLNWESRLSRLADLIMIEDGSASDMFTPQAGGTEFRSGSGERLTLQQDGRAVRRRSDESTDTFDAQGRLIERTDRNGNKVALRYGPDGRLARIEGQRGASLQFTADKNGRVTRVETSTGRTVEYAYFGDSLAEVRVNNGPVQRYGYDGSGRLARIEDPATGSFEFVYDGRGRVLSRRSGDGATERYEYDDATNTVRHIDPAGTATTMRWSPDKRRAEVTDALGGKSVMVYDGAGRLVSVTGPTGAASRMTYDSAGRLIATENAAGHVTRFEYAGTTSRFRAIVRPDGVRQTFEYDGRGNLTASKIGAETVAAFTYHPDGSIATVKGTGGSEQRFVYRPDGRIQSIANALGEASRLEYDARGNLIRTSNPLGGATTRAYDAQDRVVSITDPAGGVTRFEYDSAGRLIGVTDAVGGSTRYQYDARGRLVAETDPAGQTIRSDYDAAGRVSRRSFPDGTTETFRYDVLGNVIAAVDQSGRATQLEYDPLGRVVRERNPAGLAAEYRYDAAGNLIAQQDALGAGPTLRHDAVGRLLEIKSPTGAAIQYAYDAAGRLITITDPLGRATRYVRGAAGALSQVQERDGSVARYDYDAAGRVTVVRHPGGGETRFSYDGLGNPVQVMNPAGQSVQRAYDAAGRIVTLRRPNGQTIAYAYDALGRMVEKRLPGGTRVTFQYDVRGNLLKADDGTFPVVYTRDVFGRATRIEYPAIRRSLQYEYDAAGRVSRMTDSEGGVSRYSYDAAGRPTTIEIPGGQAIRFSYDARGRLTTTQYPNGVVGRFEYDGENRLSRLTYNDATGKSLAGWRYGFDAAGNRTETASSDGRVIRYRYDAAGQLVEEAVGGEKSVRYSYLPGGNRARREDGAQSVEYRYDAADRLLAAGNETFNYDADGNLVERRSPAGATRYEYDAESRLVKVVRPDGNDVSFGYAPTGERVWRRDATGVAYFVTDGVNVLAELDENFKSKATYLHARAIDAPLTMTRDGRTYFYHRERLGSTGLLTGERGEALASYDYDAFGALRRSEGTVANPFTYTAREFEPGIGLYYYRARYYDPGLGRFVSVDPVPPPLETPLGLNPYLYAGNNPLRFVDPLGTEFTPEQQLWMAEDSMNRMLEYAEGRGTGLPPGAFREDYLKSARGFQEQAEWLRNRPGTGAPDPPPGYGGRPFPTETPQTGGPGRVSAGGGARPGQPPPGVTQDVPAPGARGGPTEAVPRGEVPAGTKPGSSNTQAVPRPGQGGGVSIGRVVGGVATAAVSLANIAACLTDPRNSTAQCAAEAGLIVVGVAGGALILSIPAVAAAVAGSTVVVPVVVITMTAAGIYQATTRLVDSANAPAAIAEATRQAEMEARLNTVFPRMSANIEAKVAAFEAKASKTSATGARDARARAEAFADAAASNLAALRTDLAQIEASCTFAASAYMDVLALVGDAEGRLIDLDTGLTAADGMVTACTSKSDAAWAKELYQQGTGMVAEMLIRAQRADKAQGALEEARAAADRAIAAAQGRAQMIAGNAEVAAAAAGEAETLATSGLGLEGLAGEKSALESEIDVLANPNWFPAGSVDRAIAEWKRRLAAAFARAQGRDRDADQPDVSAARLAAARAESRRDEGNSLLAAAKARVDGCIQSARTAIAEAAAALANFNTRASGTLSLYATLPARADTCIANLRSLISLHVQCPPRAYVDAQVSCTATGVYDDNTSKAEDLTTGPWQPVGPSFTSPTPGPISVSVTRGNMTDVATVTFEPKPPPPTSSGYIPFDDPNFMPQGPKSPPRVGQGPVDPLPPGLFPPLTGGTTTGSVQNAPPIPGSYTGSTGQPQPGTASSGTGQPTISCWSDQLQALVPTLGYICPAANTQPGGRTPSWTDLQVSPSSPRSSGGPPPKTGGSGGGMPPPSGGSCGPMTHCKCAGGKSGHIPCDKSMGACHCGGG